MRDAAMRLTFNKLLAMIQQTPAGIPIAAQQAQKGVSSMASQVFRSVLAGRSMKAELLAYALSGAFCFPAQADVVFTNVTGTFSIDNEAPVCITPELGCPFGTVGGGYKYEAGAFTPLSDFTLTSVKVAVRAGDCASGPGGAPTCRNNSYNLALYSDSNSLPGVAIASSSGALAHGVPAVQTLNMGPVALSAGTKYWLVMLPGTGGGGSFTYWMGGGSASVPAAFISYNAFTGQNGGLPDLHQPPKWLPGGTTSTLQFEIDGVPGSQHLSYTLTTLEVPGADRTIALGINDLGTIVGEFFISPSDTGAHGFVLQEGRYTALDFPGATSTGPIGINVRGDIVGQYTSTDGKLHGFILQGNVFTTLDFPGATGTSANGINNDGDIVGDTGSGGFLYQRDVFIPIDVPFPDAQVRELSGINDRGEIVGSYFASDGSVHGFLKDGTTFIPLDVPFSGVTSTIPRGINNKGEIAGSTSYDGFVFAKGEFTQLDPPFSVIGSQAWGINDLGEIVGYYGPSSQPKLFGYLAKP